MMTITLRVSRRDSVSVPCQRHIPSAVTDKGLSLPGTFIETSMPVVDYYRVKAKVVEVRAFP